MSADDLYTLQSLVECHGGNVYVSSNGQVVECYGKFEDDSNFDCVFDDEAFNGTYCDGGSSWQAAVNKIAKYAQRNMTVLIQLEAC